MLRKIACNATNSGAIDQEGNVWVWGAGKYGLLGNPKQKNPVSKPIKLQLKSEKLILDYSSDQTFVATSLSFGQYHAAVVVNDINTNSDFNPLLYAQNILNELKAFFFKCWDTTVKKLPEHVNDAFVSEEYIIENTMKFCFRDQLSSFPHISVNSLKELMVFQAKLSFKDTVSYNRLFQDLSDNNYEDKINLKELRDQLIGRRCGNGIVLTWGIVNDGRLGVELSDQEIQNIKEKNSELIPYKPSVAKFAQDVIILKVACGNSFSIALSQEGFVYSWGYNQIMIVNHLFSLGNSGGLGLGEINISYTPKMIESQRNGHKFLNILDIACGSSHCLAVDQQGVVYSWGNGQGGRLGHGDETGENIPREIHGLRNSKMMMVEAGESNSAAISIRSELFIWGVGLHGRLGTGKTSNVLNPTLIEDLKDQKVEDVCLGSSHTLCIMRNGKAMCWGSSKDGKIGLETALDRNFTQPKELVTLEKERLFQFAAGPFHSLALTERGDIYAFGNQKDGKLGFEETKPVQIPRKIMSGPKFCRKTGLNDRREKYPLFNRYDDHMIALPKHEQVGATEVLQICVINSKDLVLQCGFSSTVFLINNGEMYTCGSNKYGQLGFSKKLGKEGGKKEAQIGAVSDDDAEGENGTHFGNGGKGPEDILPTQLRKKLAELELQQDIEKPTQLVIHYDALQKKVKHVSTGYFHVLAVTQDGLAFGWGRNDYGQLGMGRKDMAVSKPQRIKSVGDKIIIMTAAGENHSLFLSDLGEVFCAGFNEFGELGIGMINASTKKEDDKDQQDNNDDEEQQNQALYDEELQKQMIETKTEISAKVIKGLESIGFIAAGKNHSIAIRSEKIKEKAMRIYSWGCGWHGQTGHGSWHNDYTPKIVKIPVLKDTKFIMASCGSKHTIALDTNGQIWFCGHKLSVGIEDYNDEKQFTPVRLELPMKIQEPIKYIASGEEHNLAITASGTVYGFGHNVHTKINSNPKEYIYFEQVDSDEKATLVACGANHSALTDAKGFPYTWGFITNGRCGLRLENDENQQRKDHISAPTVIYSMKVLFQKEMQKFKQIIQQDQKASFQLINQEDVNARFPVQKLMKEQNQSLEEVNLINQDNQLVSKFKKMVEDFHDIVNNENTKLLSSFYTAQNALISRIYTFPTKLDMLIDVKAELPKAIIRNRQFFEAIFTLLQTHPCYIINWITKSTINRQPKEVIVILKIIFGEKEMRNNKRILHILMMIARKIFQFELDTYDVKEILWGRADSTFNQLFYLIFENQDENMSFVTQLIASILRKLQKFFLSMMRSNNNQFNVQITNKQSLQYQFDYESVIQDNSKAEQRIRFLIEFMKICFKKMLKALDPQLKGKNRSTLSSEIVSLIYTIKQEINEKRGSGSGEVSQEEVDSYILNLVFEIMFKKLQDINLDKIKDYYWNKSTSGSQEPPDKDVFNFGEKRNLVSVLADHLEKYLRKIKIHYTNPPVEVLKDFIANSKQNFRKEMSDLLNIQPINLKYLLVKDLFVNSMDFKNSTLTISISDLIFIYNTLVEKAEIIFIQNHEDDPIQLLINELGNVAIDIKQNEKQFISDEILECKMNLEIRHRLLIDYNVFTKCHECDAPVHEDLIPYKRFKEGINGKAWQCQYNDCREKNDALQLKCLRCNKYRDTATLPKDLVFDRYKQIYNDPAVMSFQLCLLYLPIIDKHQSLDDVIEYELQLEEQRKNSDYTKLQILETFIKLKRDYMFANKKKSNFEDANLEKEAMKELENSYLNELEKQMIDSYYNKKNHENKIKQYFQLLKEIKDKMSNYLQHQNQLSAELKIIAENAYTGLGSEFLRSEKQDIFAGKLHLKGGKKAASGGGKVSTAKMPPQLQANPQLENFFAELDKQASTNNAVLQNNYQELQQNKEIYKSNFGFFGKYPLYQLRQRKVLHSIQIHGKKLQTVMKKCSYVFYDDGDNGYRVELVYEEKDSSCFFFGRTSHEAILETFKIHKDTVAEMRRTKAAKATIQFGNSEFNAFHLVNLLNEIKSKTYAYQVQQMATEKEGKKKVNIGFNMAQDQQQENVDNKEQNQEEKKRI